MAEGSALVHPNDRWAPLFRPPRLSGEVLNRLLPALVGLNEDFLRQYPMIPDLYKSGVRYKREPVGQEEWLTIPYVIARGVADCEDLAAWRAAELRVRYKEQADAVWYLSKRTAKGSLYHIVVRVKRGDKFYIEDPSFLLGMPMAVPGGG